jgi:hypothetical protein
MMMNVPLLNFFVLVFQAQGPFKAANKIDQLLFGPFVAIPPAGFCSKNLLPQEIMLFYSRSRPLLETWND